jgi:PleD family two-component response regulator
MNWNLSDVKTLADKTIIVTGGNSGLGYESVKMFASKDAEIIMASRSIERGNQAVEEIKKDLPIDEQIKEIFTLLEKRSLLAKSKGNSLIIDKEYILPSTSEGNILLVDEDEVNLNMLNRIFQRAHYDVKIARGVEEAIEIIDKTRIDLIISEINLSKIDGFSLKKLLNESKDFQKIPFIMVSHNKTLENIKRGNMLNVNLILEKPIIPEELIGHVLRYKHWMKTL